MIDRLFPLHSQIIIGLVAIGMIAAIVTFTLSDMKAKAFEAGREACQSEAREALDRANETNRLREADLERQVEDYADRYEAARLGRRSAEATVVTRVEERLPAQPNCEIDPTIIELRNQLRAAS